MPLAALLDVLVRPRRHPNIGLMITLLQRGDRSGSNLTGRRSASADGRFVQSNLGALPSSATAILNTLGWSAR